MKAYILGDFREGAGEEGEAPNPRLIRWGTEGGKG